MVARTISFPRRSFALHSSTPLCAQSQPPSSGCPQVSCCSRFALPRCPLKQQNAALACRLASLSTTHSTLHSPLALHLPHPTAQSTYRRALASQERRIPRTETIYTPSKPHSPSHRPFAFKGRAMPVFTQTCTIDDGSATLSLATCTCGCLASGDMMLVDSFNSTDASSSSDEHAGPAPMFIHIDGVLHWSTCALHTSALNGGTSGNKNSIARLKQQQQSQHPTVGGLALLRKTPTSVAQSPRWYDPFAPVRLLPTRTAHLAAGSRFQGKQKSGSSSYDVLVDIKVKRGFLGFFSPVFRKLTMHTDVSHFV